ATAHGALPIVGLANSPQLSRARRGSRQVRAAKLRAAKYGLSSSLSRLHTSASRNARTARALVSRCHCSMMGRGPHTPPVLAANVLGFLDFIFAVFARFTDWPTANRLTD